MAHQVAPQVYADLDEIWFNIVRESGGNVAAADRVIDSVTERFALISQYPRFGRARDHDLRPGYRSTPVGEYTIIYTIGDGDEALILYVFPSRRDIPNLLGLPRS